MKSIPLFDKKGHVGETYVRPPKKKRTSQQVDYNSLTEDQLRERSRAAAARQYKEKRKDVFSNAREATDAQIWKLSNLLGDASRDICCSYVCWANGHYWGTPYTLTKWGKGLYISRIYWIRAIEMALKGSNDLFSAEDLMAQAMGFDNHFEQMRQDLFSKTFQ